MDLVSETDRLRLEFLSTELELSMTFIRLAKFEFESGDRLHGQHLLGEAGKACEVLRRFLADPRHARHLPEEEKRRLSDGVRQLDGHIKTLSNRHRAA
jgi:hypothetical protein